MDESLIRSIAHGLLQASKPTEVEIERQTSLASDPDYWRALQPGLSIEGDWSTAGLEENPLDASSSTRQLGRLRKQGYFLTGPVLRSELVQRMRQCVERLRVERWPAVFSFVYDEFWEVFRAPSVVRLAEAFLGSEYAQSAVLWAWHIDGVEGAHGWRPHADNPKDLRAITIWIPLSDATVDNGCLYLIPKDCVPDSLAQDFGKWTEVKKEEMSELLQGVRALPAAAGSLLGWDQEVIHWGSRASPNANPRISIASVLVAKDARDALQLTDLASLPTFCERLRLIGERIQDYRDHEPGLARFEGLAARINGTCSPSNTYMNNHLAPGNPL